MIEPSEVLSAIPKELRVPLIAEYRGICGAFNEGRWKLAALDAGRFCEVAYTILHGAVSGAFDASPTKPANFVASCRALESLPPIATGDRSLRILIPRVLPALYEIRNNRDVGHVGGDVASNKMDATYVRDACAWVVAELIRVFHNVSTTEAQKVVDALIERTHPLVWEVGDVKRVLDTRLSASERALVLLYATPGWVAVSALRGWVGYGPGFRQRVLDPLFAKRQVELDASSATITPLGAKLVEDSLLKD